MKLLQFNISFDDIWLCNQALKLRGRLSSLIIKILNSKNIFVESDEIFVRIFQDWDGIPTQFREFLTLENEILIVRVEFHHLWVEFSK